MSAAVTQTAAVAWSPCSSYVLRRVAPGRGSESAQGRLQCALGRVGSALPV